ncbi:MAG: acyltransferase family protein [Arenicella sp.]
MKTKIFYGLVFVISFLICQQLIQFFALQSFNILTVEGTFTPRAKLHFRNSNGLYPIDEKTQVNSGVLPQNTTQALKFQLKNRTIKRFSLDVIHQGDNYHISKITLASHFARNTFSWNTEQIASAFTVKRNPDQRTTHYILNSPVKGKNAFLFWVIPLFMAYCLALLISYTNWREFPAVKDLLSNQQSRNTNNFSALDGFRGLAALLVLLHHTAGSFKGGGNLGVWMFFVLSGFLLTKTFVVNPTQNLTISGLSHFMQRRFKRIIPMYFAMITCMYLLQYRYEDAVRHYLFIQGDGHFWTILQEMYFYLLLPILTAITYLICRGNIILSIITLGLAASVWNRYGVADVFSIYGLNQPLRAYFEVFIVGMLGAYWYHGIYSQSQRLRAYSERFQLLISLVGIALLVFMLSITVSNWLGVYLAVKKHSFLTAFLCLTLILLAVIGRHDSWYNRLLSNPALRYIGIIGYSFYLLHPYAIFFIRNGIEHILGVPPENISEYWRIAAALGLTTVLASFTYSFIERPFLTNKKRT